MHINMYSVIISYPCDYSKLSEQYQRINSLANFTNYSVAMNFFKKTYD